MKHSAEMVRAARRLAALIFSMGGQDLRHLSDDELVDRMTTACETIGKAVAQIGISAREAGENLARAGVPLARGN